MGIFNFKKVFFTLFLAGFGLILSAQAQSAEKQFCLNELAKAKELHSVEKKDLQEAFRKDLAKMETAFKKGAESLEKKYNPNAEGLKKKEKKEQAELLEKAIKDLSEQHAKETQIRKEKFEEEERKLESGFKYEYNLLNKQCAKFDAAEEIEK